MLRVLQEELKKTAGELKKMSADGKLTSDLVSGALMKSLIALEIQSSKLPATLGGAFNVLKNEFTIALGKLNESAGVTKDMTNFILGLADALRIYSDSALTAFNSLTKVLTENLIAITALFSVYVAYRANVILAAKATVVMELATKAASLASTIYAGVLAALRVGVIGYAAVTAGATTFTALFSASVGTATAAVTGLRLAVGLLTGGLSLLIGYGAFKFFSGITESIENAGNASSDLSRQLRDAKENLTLLQKEGTTDDDIQNFNSRKNIVLQYNEEIKKANEQRKKLEESGDYGKKEQEAYKKTISIAKELMDVNNKRQDENEKRAAKLKQPEAKGIDDKAAKEAADKLAQMREFSAQYATQIADLQRINALVAEGKSIEDARYKVELDRQLIDARKSGATEKQISDMRAALEVSKQQTDAAKEYEEALKLIQDVEKEVAADRAKAIEDGQKALEDFLKPEKFEIGDLFGEASKSAGAFINALQEINKNSEDYAKIMEDVTLSQKDREKATKKQQQNELRGIGSILGATKGFFKEKSTGYRVLSAAEKAFRVIELAGLAKSTALTVTKYVTESSLFTALHATKLGGMAEELGLFLANAATQIAGFFGIGTAAAAAGVAAASIQPGPAAFVGFAAMAALMASIGFGIGGGSRGATRTNFSANTAAGTGTVLGDPTAKSETLTKSIDRLADIASVDLEFSSQTLNVLKEIAANTGSFNTSLANLNVKIGAEIRNISLPGNFTASQVKTDPNKFSSQFFAALVGETNNFPNTQGKAVGNIFTQQVILPVIKGFEDVAKLAGATTSEINKSLSSTVITGGRFGGEDGGRNLNQLSAEDKTALVNATASTLLDQLTTELLKASPSLAYLRDFQLAGEGLGETIIRVKSDIEVANKALFRLGYGAISLQAIVNKQGDIAVEAIKQVTSQAFGQRGLTGIASIISKSFIETGEDAEELVSDLTSMSNAMRGLGRTSVDITASTLGGAGSFDRLKDGFDSIFSDLLSPAERTAELTKQVGDKFRKLGIALPANNDELKNLIKGFNTSTEAGQSLFGSVVALVPEFVNLQNSMEDIGSSAQEVGESLNEVAKNLYQTIADARSKALTPTQSVDFLLGQFREAQTLALSQNGQALATTAGDINSQINPLLEAIKEVYASGETAQRLIDEVLGGAKAVADKAATESFTFQDESLRLLQTQVNELEAIRIAIQGGTYSPQNIIASAMGNAFSGGNVIPFARGGAFTNSIVSQPTMFPLGIMGEAGAEAVMPLARGSDGSLGVRIVGGGNSSAGVESKLDESNKQSAALVRLQQEANKRIIEKLSAMEERLGGLESAARLEAAS